MIELAWAVAGGPARLYCASVGISGGLRVFKSLRLIKERCLGRLLYLSPCSGRGARGREEGGGGGGREEKEIQFRNKQENKQ